MLDLIGYVLLIVTFIGMVATCAVGKEDTGWRSDVATIMLGGGFSSLIIWAVFYFGGWEALAWFAIFILVVFVTVKIFSPSKK